MALSQEEEVVCHREGDGWSKGVRVVCHMKESGLSTEGKEVCYKGKGIGCHIDAECSIT